MMLSEQNRKELLGKIDTLVATKYYDRTFGGKSWQAIVAVHRDSILSAGSTEAFEAAVAQMLDQLSPTLGLLSRQTKITARNSINASFRRVTVTSSEQRWAFQDVLPGGVAAQAGIRSGDVVVAIDGHNPDMTHAPSFAMNHKVPITIDRNGQHHELHLDLTTQRPKYRDNPYSEPCSATARLISRNTGVMTVALFPGKIGIDFANHVSYLFTNTLQSAQRLLIDLRGNPGGGIGGLRLMSYLTPRSLPIGYNIDRKTAEQGYDKERLPRLNHIPRSKWELILLAFKFGNKKSVVLETENLGPQSFHNRIGILVNEHSTGAAEMLIQFAKENKLATIIGSKTPGRLVSRAAFKIGHDYRLVIPIGAYHSWNGIQIEGKGIEPDVEADWSFQAAQKEKDPQMEQALETVATL